MVTHHFEFLFCPRRHVNHTHGLQCTMPSCYLQLLPRNFTETDCIVAFSICLVYPSIPQWPASSCYPLKTVELWLSRGLRATQPLLPVYDTECQIAYRLTYSPAYALTLPAACLTLKLALSTYWIQPWLLLNHVGNAVCKRQSTGYQLIRWMIDEPQWEGELWGLNSATRNRGRSLQFRVRVDFLIVCPPHAQFVETYQLTGVHYNHESLKRENKDAAISSD